MREGGLERGQADIERFTKLVELALRGLSQITPDYVRRKLGCRRDDSLFAHGGGAGGAIIVFVSGVQRRIDRRAWLTDCRGAPRRPLGSRASRSGERRSPHPPY